MAPYPQYSYEAELIRVVDGDTVRLRLFKDIDIGFYVEQTISTEMNFRLRGMDTPEVRGEERPEGLIAKAALEEMIEEAEFLRAVTFKPDKYGRWLVDLFATYDDEVEEVCLNDRLIDEGYAVPYMRG